MDAHILYIHLVLGTSFLPVFSGKQITAYGDGDIIIGAMLQIYERSGRIRDEGIIQAEVLMKTIDDINKDKDILRDVKLGFEIMDTGGSYEITTDHTLNIIKDELIAKDLYEVITNGRSLDQFDKCWMKPKTPISVLIGPDTSLATLNVQRLLSFIEVPQVGFAATSDILDDKFVNTYFLRVVPSQSFQMKALVDMLKYFNWTYVSVVYTEGHTGYDSYNTFSRAARSAGVCLAGTYVVMPHSTSDIEDAKQIIQGFSYHGMFNYVQQ